MGNRSGFNVKPFGVLYNQNNSGKGEGARFGSKGGRNKWRSSI